MYKWYMTRGLKTQRSGASIEMNTVYRRFILQVQWMIAIFHFYSISVTFWCILQNTSAFTCFDKTYLSFFREEAIDKDKKLSRNLSSAVKKRYKTKHSQCSKRISTPTAASLNWISRSVLLILSLHISRLYFIYKKWRTSARKDNEQYQEILIVSTELCLRRRS